MRRQSTYSVWSHDHSSATCRRGDPMGSSTSRVRPHTGPAPRPGDRPRAPRPVAAGLDRSVPVRALRLARSPRIRGEHGDPLRDAAVGRHDRVRPDRWPPLGGRRRPGPLPQRRPADRHGLPAQPRPARSARGGDRGGHPGVRRVVVEPGSGATEERTMRAISRRAALTGALGLVGGAVLGSTGGCANPSRDQTARLLASTTPLPERFTVPFVVPTVKQPVARAGGASAYEIVQRRAVLEILPGRQTEVLGYDGLFPGPTIIAPRGEQVTVTHRNELYLPTVVHLHGGHTAAASD